MATTQEAYDWEHRYTRESRRPQPAQEDIDYNWRVITSIVHADGAFNGGIDLVENLVNTELAIRKRLRPTGVYGREEHLRWRREMLMMRKLSHPNIPYYIDGFFSPNKGSIYMQACRLGSLRGFIKSRRQTMLTGELQELFLWHVLHDIALAIFYMQTGYKTLADAKRHPRHEKRSGWISVAHCDIRPDQIFLHNSKDDPTPRALLGDFGFAQFLKPWVRYEGHDGRGAATSSKAPEFPHQISEATDVFGLGIVAQMYLNPGQKLRHGFNRLWLHHQTGASPMLDTCIRQCCATKPADRPNIKRVVETLEWGLSEMRRYGHRIENVTGPLFKSLYAFPSDSRH